MYAKKRHSEKITMKKTIAQHSERDNKHKAEEAPKGAVPHYLLDREQARAAARLCSARLGCACAARGGQGLDTHHRILLHRGAFSAMRSL